MSWKNTYRSALLDITEESLDIRNIVTPHIPVKLYKYGNFKNSYWKDTVFKGKLHLSAASEFNDPFDCKAQFDYKASIQKGKFRETLLKHFSMQELNSLSEELINLTVKDMMRKDVYVFCFSELWDSMLMWAHYSDNYNGFCIEYETDKMSDNVKYKLRPVLYEKNYIDITQNLIHLNRNTGLITYVAKAQDWSYESEWRIIENRNNPFYVRNSIKAVYLGMNCSEMIKKEILEWGKINNKEIYIIGTSRNDYNLEAKIIK